MAASNFTPIVTQECSPQAQLIVRLLVFDANRDSARSDEVNRKLAKKLDNGGCELCRAWIFAQLLVENEPCLRAGMATDVRVCA